MHTQVTNNETQGEIKLKTRSSAPKVLYTDDVLKHWETHNEANDLCIKAVGQIVMGMTGGKTGWHEDGKVYLQYNKKENTLTANLFSKYK